MRTGALSKKIFLAADSRAVARQLDARKTREHLTFEQWLAALDSAALSAGFRCRVAATTGAECWRDYYDGGMTPDQALTEDLSHA